MTVALHSTRADDLPFLYWRNPDEALICALPEDKSKCIFELRRSTWSTLKFSVLPDDEFLGWIIFFSDDRRSGRTSGGPSLRSIFINYRRNDLRRARQVACSTTWCHNLVLRQWSVFMDVAAIEPET